MLEMTNVSVSSAYCEESKCIVYTVYNPYAYLFGTKFTETLKSAEDLEKHLNTVYRLLWESNNSRDERYYIGIERNAYERSSTDFT